MQMVLILKHNEQHTFLGKTAMSIANVNGVNLSYTVQGSGDWLVLIGGYASSNWQSWGNILLELSKSYKVLAFDNRGIAGSDVPDFPYTTPMLADDVLGLMDHLNIDKARILGKSMGGSIAQWVTLKQPNRVQCLAMTSTTSRLDARAKKMVAWWIATARKCGYEALFPGELTYFYTADFYDKNPQLIQKAEDALINVHRPIEGFANMGHALIHHDTADLLHKIEVPTLLICGEDDMITPSAHTIEMARKIKNSEVHIIPKTLHGVLSEKPETFSLIIEFFTKNGSMR